MKENKFNLDTYKIKDIWCRNGFYGESQQDKYILNVLKFKKKGFFLEIGSNDPVFTNNTFLLETKYEWNGIMIDYEKKWIHLWKKYRPGSIHIINDATEIDYKELFEINNFPSVIDYLQIDLEADQGTALKTLEKLEREVMDKYKFSVVTFEHDYYCAKNSEREKSREIFKKMGYFCVFEDISNGGNPYEDWYVHPELVDMEYVNKLRNNNINKYQNSKHTHKMLEWKNINF